MGLRVDRPGKDDGGVRGLSSLVVVSELMKRIQRHEGLEDTPAPCDHFDIIAGVGTGAVIACLLGRLQMPVARAVSFYIRLMKTVFSDKKLFSSGGSGAFKLRRLKQALSEMVRDATGNGDEPMRSRQSENNVCKTMIFAMSRHSINGSTPTIIRSYEASVNPGPDCLIWEALSATMAHPDLFESVDIGESPVQQSFVGGGLGLSNPIIHVLSETKAVYPGCSVASIVSVGTGHLRTIQIPKSGLLPWILPARVIDAMKSIASDREMAAQEMERRFRNTGVYFRFNVDQGMQNVGLSEWKRLDEIVAYTHTYLQGVEVSGRIEHAAQVIKGRAPTISTDHIDGQVQCVPEAIALKHCPAPTIVFTGRRDQIEQVEECILGGASARRVCVVHGLGGAGKTQLTLKVIERTQEKWTNVLYVDASSCEAIESTLRAFASVQKIGSTYQDTIRWLQSCRKQWLLVFDNADSPLLNIHDFFPGGDHGSILITTRQSEMTMLSQPSGFGCCLSGMDKRDALELLFRTACIQGSSLPDDEMKSAEHLVMDFGYLALAIVHAGAYIGRCHMSVSDYRELFLARLPTSGMLEEYAKLPLRFRVDHYPKTVGTTWEMCYELLGPLARSLLWLISFLHYDLITENIFRRAAIHMRSYQHIVPPNELEAAAHIMVRDTLNNFVDLDGSWNSLSFYAVITEISSCSLLEYDRANKAYKVHVLVQGWARTVIPHAQELAVECTTILLSMSIDSHNTSKSHTFRRSIVLHVSSLLSEHKNPIGADSAARFAQVYFERGQWTNSEKLETQVKLAREALLGSEHPDTLESMSNIAYIHECQGRVNEAVELHLRVLGVRKRSLGEQHLDTLKSADQLAVAYRAQGRWDKAAKLHSQALAGRMRILGEDSPDTLASMSNLASTFVSLGRWSEAEKLHTKVFDARKNLLGEEHPDTLDVMNHLAITYRRQGRWDKATELQKRVLDARKRVLGEDHPDTLISMSNLSTSRGYQGQWEEATILQLQVLDTRKRLLGEHHPSTLTSLNNLGYLYLSQSRWEEAATILKQGLEGREQILGAEHPDTLLSMNNLALAYHGQGFYNGAEELHIRARDGRKQLHGTNHPDTLMSMNHLAQVYLGQGRLPEAEELQLQTSDARKRVLGNEHPDTLTSLHNLAVVYGNQGRWEESEKLLATAISARKRVLGKKHPETLASISCLASNYRRQGLSDEAEAVLGEE